MIVFNYITLHHIPDKNELTLLNEVIDVEDGISSDSLGLMDSSLSLRYLDFSLFFDRFVFDSKEAELSELSCLW